MSGILTPRRMRSPATPPRHQPEAAAAVLLAAGIGAAAMYLLDPARGRRRRHLIADRVTSLAHRTSDTVEKTSRDLANHARGLAAAAHRPFSPDEADDTVVQERVRAELGRVVSHPSVIQVDVDDGVVMLTGAVLDDEADELVECIEGVRGVRGVEDSLTRYDSSREATDSARNYPPVL